MEPAAVDQTKQARLSQRLWQLNNGRRPCLRVSGPPRGLHWCIGRSGSIQVAVDLEMLSNGVRVDVGRWLPRRILKMMISGESLPQRLEGICRIMITQTYGRKELEKVVVVH